MEAVHQQRSQQLIQNRVKIGRLFGPQFLEVPLPPGWAGSILAFNGTFTRSNPTVAASTGSTLGGAWRWEAAPIPDAWGGGRAAGGPENGPYTHVPMCMYGPRYVFYLIYPPPRELNLHYRGGGQVPYHWARGGGTSSWRYIVRTFQAR